MALNYHNIDPVAISLSGINITWYGLSYIIGILLGLYYVRILNKKNLPSLDEKLFDDFILYIIFGIIVGGRLGYVIFYNFSEYIHSPIEIFKTWKGGMSFHGGLIGVIITTVLFCRKNKIKLFYFLDYLACSAPIVIFFVRIANFINGELFGRVTNAPWGMIFPSGGDEPRHMSQLYESFGEGMVIFIIMFILWFLTDLKRKHGLLSGIFLCLYGIIRIILENFREPDFHLGFIYHHITMGMILSLPLIIFGLFMSIIAYKRKL